MAEGIEDDATLQLLTDLGCDLAQGYLISIPKPPSHLAFIDSSRRAVTDPISRPTSFAVTL